MLMYFLLLWAAGWMKLREYNDPMCVLSPSSIMMAFWLILPFGIFIYIYTIYLIPYYFKRNLYREFWFRLVAFLAGMPLVYFVITYVLSFVYPGIHFTSPKATPIWTVLGAYGNFLANFIGVTSLLFVMELLEQIRTSKEIIGHEHQLAATELHLLKTQVDPGFMLRSLDGIIHLSEQKAKEAPDAIVQFADLLRYRLYSSTQKMVSLQEEIRQLEHLFLFHRYLLKGSSPMDLEIEGRALAKFILPLSLIQLAEPLLGIFNDEVQGSLHLYILIEEEALQVAIELQVGPDIGQEQKIDAVREDLGQLLGTSLNFTTEKHNNNYSISTCIPLIR